MSVLCQLRDPENYRPCTFDLLADRESLTHWLDHFETHIEDIFSLARAQSDKNEKRIESCRTEYLDGLRQLRETPEAFGPINMLFLDLYRTRMLRKHGMYDPFEDVKRKEDDEALKLYPSVVAEIDALPHTEKMISLLRGVFAGNIFDLGSKATLDQYNEQGLDFDRTRANLKPRPWLVDHADAFCKRFSNRRSPYEQVLFFVDNAGADVVLGCLPLARQLAAWGSRVVFAANTVPCLNDITLPELIRVLADARDRDPKLADLILKDRIDIIGSGNDAPLIDLARITEECDVAAEESDLLILEGMGRAVESNYNTLFNCDCLKIAMLKDSSVASALGGELFDLVCRFDRGERR